MDRKASIVTDGDAVAHITYVKEYYKTQGRPIDLSYKYVFDEPDYPNGYHKFLYYLKIPIRSLENWGGYFPVFFDFCLLAVTAFAMVAFGGSDYIWLLVFPFLRMFYGNNGRAHHLSERAYGGLMGNIYLLCVAGYWVTLDAYWLVLAMLPFFIFSVSSKFTWQGTFFVTLGLCVALKTPFFLLIYAVYAAASVVLSKGYSWTVLKGLIRHSYFYQSYLSPRVFELRDNYLEILTLFKKTPKAMVRTGFTNSPLRVVTDNPLNIVFLALILSAGEVDFWAAWGLVGVVLTWLISIKPLKFLGEPERYLEFTFVPVLLTLSHYSLSDINTLVLLGAAVVALSTFLFHYVIFVYSTKVSKDKQMDMIELREFTNKLSGKLILSIPFRLSFFLGYENDDNKFLTLFSHVGGKENIENYKWLLKDRYPFVRGDLKDVSKKHNFDYLVIDKNQADKMNEVRTEYYDLSGFKTVFENKTYAVLTAK